MIVSININILVAVTPEPLIFTSSQSASPCFTSPRITNTLYGPLLVLVSIALVFQVFVSKRLVYEEQFLLSTFYNHSIYQSAFFKYPFFKSSF